jgi:MinD superfamily P-loop ATPase
MIIAFASGKGGTGKTTMSLGLALSLDLEELVLLDCDVEEPNLHIFLPLEQLRQETVNVFLPSIDVSKCNGCGQCVVACEYKALACVQQKALLFSDLCHSCGVCSYICPQQAILEKPYGIGTLQQGFSDSICFTSASLNVGSSLTVPLIKAVKKSIPDNSDIPVIIDCPPGASCAMVHSVKDADAVVLVTEPTPFGFHDLTLLIDSLKTFYKGIIGIILNRCDIGNYQVESYCLKNKLPILMRIPNDLTIAKAYANGTSIITAKPELKDEFKELYDRLMSERFAHD